jgi:hypothetical protein
MKRKNMSAREREEQIRELIKIPPVVFDLMAVRQKMMDLVPPIDKLTPASLSRDSLREATTELNGAISAIGRAIADEMNLAALIASSPNLIRPSKKARQRRSD